MSDTLITIIGIFIAAILMFVFPLMTVSNTQDDIAQVSVQALVAEFVNNAATKGKITQDDYNTFLSKLYATGNTYDVQLEHKKMTTNPNKGASDQLGENLYYSVYNSVIVDSNETGVKYNKEYLMKKGDYIIATVKNTNTTIASQIKTFAYSTIEKDTYRIAASSSALVVNTGNKNVVLGDGGAGGGYDDIHISNPIETFSYKIIYHRNHASSDTEKVQKQYTYNDEVDFSNQGFPKKTISLGELDFCGWNTKPDGTGAMVNNMTQIRSWITQNNMEFHLYAIWEPYIDLNWSIDGTKKTSDNGKNIEVYLKIDETVYGYRKDFYSKTTIGAVWEISKVKIGSKEYNLIEPVTRTVYSGTEILVNVTTSSGTITGISINGQPVLSMVDINWKVNGTDNNYTVSFNGSTVYAMFEINGQRNNYTDYWTLLPVGTPWKIYGLKYNGIEHELHMPIENNTRDKRSIRIMIETNDDGTINLLGVQ